MRQATLEDRAEYLGVIAFVRLARSLPARSALQAANALGTLFFDLVRYRRTVALTNLRSRLGGDGDFQRLRDGEGAEGGPGGGAGGADGVRGGRSYRRIGRRAMQTFMEGLVEFVRLPCTGRPYLEKHFSIAGIGNLDEALSRGRGAVLVTGHFGSWELAGPVLASFGYPVDLLVGVQRNLLVQDLMNGMRRDCGVGVIEPERLIRAVRSLRANRLVAMLCDQDAGRRGVFVDFLGAPASTTKGPARLAILAGSPVVPGFILRTGGLSHKIVIERPIWPGPEASERAVFDLTQAYTDVIASYVRRYPGHWLWTHRRWKTRPG